MLRPLVMNPPAVMGGPIVASTITADTITATGLVTGSRFKATTRGSLAAPAFGIAVDASEHGLYSAAANQLDLARQGGQEISMAASYIATGLKTTFQINATTVDLVGTVQLSLLRFIQTSNPASPAANTVYVYAADAAGLCTLYSEHEDGVQTAQSASTT